MTLHLIRPRATALGTPLLLVATVVVHASAVLAQEPPGREQVETKTKKSTPTVTFTSVSSRMLQAADADGGRNWLLPGRAYSNERWSPLKQITPRNVQQLVVKWIYQPGVSTLGTQEMTPVVVDGVMYVTAPPSTVAAVDAKTGREVWRTEIKLGQYLVCCGPVNRGVAVADSTVYMYTLDSRLMALNAKTGATRWEIQVADPSAGYSGTHQPIVVGDKVILGTAGGEYGIRGFVRAYQKDTGKLVWQFWTVPDKGWEGKWSETTWEGEPLHRDIARERADSAKYADAWQHGGGSVWMNAAFDPELQLLFLAVGNPSPDLHGERRPGDNLYTDCIIALDVNTGALRWYYQELPHDLWDLDAASAPVIVRLKDGTTAVAEAGKTGWVYVLDAKTGKLIRRSEPFVRQENMFAHPTPEGVRMLPGANGGADWNPVAVHPGLGYVFVPGLEQPMLYKGRFTPYAKGQLWFGSAFVAVPTETQYGNITAIDLNTGKKAWQVRTDEPMITGVLATAGDVIFTGEGNGRFRALDARTGKSLWSFQAGAGCNAPPVTYEVDGKQHVAVACGGLFQLNYRLGSTILDFALPD